MQKEELTRDPNLTNPLVLAFLGDATYAHCVRYHLIAKGLVKPNQLHKAANRYVSAKAQANVLLALMPTLPEEELNVVKRGGMPSPAPPPKMPILSTTGMLRLLKR